MQMIESQTRNYATQALADLLIDATREHCEFANRREHARYPCSTPIRLGRVDEYGQFRPVAEVCSSDVSQGGLGLLAKVPLRIGDVFWLELQSATPRAWRLQARIVYCRPLFADVFHIGAAFMES
jgi:hypothetical protein